MAAKAKKFNGATKVFEARSKRPKKSSTGKKRSQAWRAYTSVSNAPIPD
jgi:hypothetical protein